MSGSVAEPVTDTNVSAAPLCVGGRVITGFRFEFPMVRVVVAGVAVPAVGVALSTAVQLIV
jgi:hypothetical protein